MEHIDEQLRCEMFWIIICTGVVLLVFAGASRSPHHVQRDPRRSFTAQQRTVIFARAGNQCEHFDIIGRRCTAAPTHADHVFPWSKGGSTTASNAQALCARHNLIKGSAVVPTIHIARLERRRRRYFPPGVPVEVVWRTGRQ